MSERWFPMQDGPPIPWEFAEAIYKWYAACFGHGQSLERLAERGGFGYSEIPHIMGRLQHKRERDAREQAKSGAEGAKS